MKMIRMFFTLAALLFLEAAPLTAQIPPSEMPPPGTDTGLDGKIRPGEWHRATDPRQEC